MTQDEALKAAGDIIIDAFPDKYGSITFNLQGNRKTIHANVNSKMIVQSGDRMVDVDMLESKKL